MANFSNTKTRVNGGGKQRTWAGVAKKETILNWLSVNGIYLGYVEVTAIEKCRSVGIEYYTLRCESAAI